MLLVAGASPFLRRQAVTSSTAAFRFGLSTLFQERQQQRSFAADTIHKLDVTPDHLETIKATLPAVAQVGTDFTKHFYGRMFKAHPELKNVFNQTNQALGSQPQKLLKTVALAAQMALETGELPGAAIESICQKHCALGVSEEEYGVVGAHLLGTIEDLLTDDKAVLDAWGEMYGGIVQAFVTREKEIANKVANIPGSWRGRRSFKLVEKEKLCTMVTRFKFEPVDGKPTPDFDAGAYTTIWATLDEEGPYGHYTEQPRHYTLAIPREGTHQNHMSISVKREGLVSRMLHMAELGTQWDLSAPYGCFTMSGVSELWLNDIDAPVVLISAGVGITPVLAMLENIYTTRPASWLHATQNGDNHAYRDRLRCISAVRAGDLKRRVWYDSPTEADGKPGGDEVDMHHLYNVAKYHYKGRMDLTNPELANPKEDVLHLGNPIANYYLCGPGGFMDAQKETLLKLGVAGDRIHWEGFA